MTTRILLLVTVAFPGSLSCIAQQASSSSSSSFKANQGWTAGKTNVGAGDVSGASSLGASGQPHLSGLERLKTHNFNSCEYSRQILCMTEPSLLRKLQFDDRALLEKLEHRVRNKRDFAQWRNIELAKLRAEISSAAGLAKVQGFLERKGTFTIQLAKKRFRDTDGEALVITCARAASTDMWPMGASYWVRDNALIAARYLFSTDRKHQRLGKDLLLSAITFMSTTSQIARFEGIIRSTSAAYHRIPTNWPYIFASISDNLSTSRDESWSHKQDAWQIAAFYLIEALEAGLISSKELTTKHKRFLSLIVPFLAKVSFWSCENSGSWEEIPAVRTSVRAWEHRLIIKLLKLSEVNGFGFIEKGYLEDRRYLPAVLRKLGFERAVLNLERRVIKEVVRDLPSESPRYARSDARHRLGDAALIYLLMIDYPYFLAARTARSPQWARQIEAKVLKAVTALEDPITGAIRRYKGDCYQRVGYFHNVTIQKLAEIGGAPSGDFSGHFLARNKAVPKGREAAWTHFVWQLSAWSGRRYLETGSKVYEKLHTEYFKRGMSLITGKGEVSIEQDARGKPRVTSIPPFRMPECYMTERMLDGRDLVIPSPHTPLNWAVAEMFDAFGVRRQILAGGLGI